MNYIICNDVKIFNKIEISKNKNLWRKINNMFGKFKNNYFFQHWIFFKSNHIIIQCWKKKSILEFSIKQWHNDIIIWRRILMSLVLYSIPIWLPHKWILEWVRFSNTRFLCLLGTWGLTFICEMSSRRDGEFLNMRVLCLLYT